MAAIFLGGRDATAILVPPALIRDSLRPPVDWLASAPASDVLRVPGRRVYYWGRPDVEYGIDATAGKRPFSSIVIHCPIGTDIIRTVRYQHNGDSRRGGHFGYHVYVGSQGEIVQGAPLSVRTNHVKADMIPGVDNESSIGITAVGACRRYSKAFSDAWEWASTAEQDAAIRDVTTALQSRYGMRCDRVWGHGEVQRNKLDAEGARLAKQIRGECE